MNWNTGTTGTTGTHFFSTRLLKCCDASSLQGPPGGCSPLWGPFCDGPSPRWPQPFAQGFDSRVFPSPCVSFHPHHPLSHVITRYLTLSHPIASYRTIGLAERLIFAAWTRFLGRPASRLATADVRLPCRIQVSTVFDILTHKGRAQPVTGQAPPQTQSEERNPPMPPRAGSRAPGESPRRRRSVAF